MIPVWALEGGTVDYILKPYQKLYSYEDGCETCFVSSAKFQESDE